MQDISEILCIIMEKTSKFQSIYAESQSISMELVKETDVYFKFFVYFS
jgi:hypothetical protein